jgi:hypothetical protein
MQSSLLRRTPAGMTTAITVVGLGVFSALNGCDPALNLTRFGA